MANKATAIEHKDVRGNTLYYLKIENDKTKKDHLVNVGVKTYDAIKNLEKTDEDPNQIKIPIEDTKNKK